MFLRGVLFASLFLAAISSAPDFVDEIGRIEEEINSNGSSENNGKVAEIKGHLEKFYHDICTLQGDGINSTFLSDSVRVNMDGKRVEEDSLRSKASSLATGVCPSRDLKVLDVEVHDDSAIAFVAGVNDPGSRYWVEIQELKKDENSDWKTDIILHFTESDISEELEDDDTETVDVKEHLKNFYRDVCGASVTETYPRYLTHDVKLNEAGKKYINGDLGVQQDLSDSHSCRIDELKVVDVEISGDSAIAMVIGHADLDRKGEPFVEVHELLKGEDGGWKIDTKILFIEAKLP